METLSTFHEPGKRWYSFPKMLSGRLRNLVWQKFITFTIYDVMNLIINKLWYVLFPFLRDWQGQASLDLGPTKRKLLHFRNSSVSFSAWHAERNEVFTNLFKLTDHDFDNRVYLTRGIATFQTMESWIILWRWKFEFQWETTGKESQLANAPPNPARQQKERGSQFQGIQFLNFNFKGYSFSISISRDNFYCIGHRPLQLFLLKSPYPNPRQTGSDLTQSQDKMIFSQFKSRYYSAWQA